MFEWYFLANKADFEATGLTSFEAKVVLNGIGEKTVLFTKGNLISIYYDTYFLPIGLNGANPFRYGNYAVFLDQSDDIWLGVYSEV
jgi:hypothetical protein